MKTSNSDRNTPEINLKVKSLQKSLSQLKRRKELSLQELHELKEESSKWHERIKLSGKYPVKHAFSLLEELEFDFHCERKYVISQIVENMILKCSPVMQTVWMDLQDNYNVDLHGLVAEKKRLREKNQQLTRESEKIHNKYRTLQDEHSKLQEEIIQLLREKAFGLQSRLKVVE